MEASLPQSQELETENLPCDTTAAMEQGSQPYEIDA
jgi:hypothetical protein